MKNVNVISYGNFGMISGKKNGGCYTYFNQLKGCLEDLGYNVLDQFNNESEATFILDTPKFLSFKRTAKYIKKCNTITLEQLKEIEYDEEKENDLIEMLSVYKNKKIFLVEHGNLETLLCHNYLKVIEILKSNGNDITILMNTKNEERIYNELGVKTYLFYQPVYEVESTINKNNVKKTYIFNSRIAGKGFYKVFDYFKEKLKDNTFDLIFRGVKNKNGLYQYNFVSEKTVYFKGYIDDKKSNFDNLIIKNTDENILYENSTGLYGGQPFMCGKIEYALLEYIYNDINVLILDRWIDGYIENNYKETYGIDGSEFTGFLINNELIENKNYEEVYKKIKQIFNKDATKNRLIELLK